MEYFLPYLSVNKDVSHWNCSPPVWTDEGTREEYLRSSSHQTWCEELTRWERPWVRLGKIEGRRRQQRMRRLDGITDSMDMGLSKFQETVKDRKPGMCPWGHRVEHNLGTEEQQSSHQNTATPCSEPQGSWECEKQNTGRRQLSVIPNSPLPV